MTDPLLQRFEQHEADNIALALQLHGWSQILIAQLIHEQEAKLVASDLPVVTTHDDAFWEALS